MGIKRSLSIRIDSRFGQSTTNQRPIDRTGRDSRHGAPAPVAGGALDGDGSGDAGGDDSGGDGSTWLADGDGSGGPPGPDGFPGPGSDGLADGFPADGCADGLPGPGADSCALADGDPESLSADDGAPPFPGLPPPSPGCPQFAPPTDCGPSAPLTDPVAPPWPGGLESSCARTLMQPVTASTGRSRAATARARTGRGFMTATSAEFGSVALPNAPTARQDTRRAPPVAL